MPPLSGMRRCGSLGGVRPTQLAARTVAAGAVAGAALTAYAMAEARAFTLRRVELPLLPAGQRPLRVLHLSDLHMTPGQRRKQEWVRGLAALSPTWSSTPATTSRHRDAVPVVLEALGRLLDVPGVFVFGSNDYYAPTLRNPVALPAPRRRQPQHQRRPQLPWPELRTGLRRRRLARPDQPPPTG